ncbi:MAG: MFS transporter, partial [Spirochaetota bacterium]
GGIADRVSSPRRLIAAALGIAGCAVLLIPVTVSWYPGILMIALVYSLSANSLPAVLDGWIMARREENPRINFGLARGFGSAGFAVAAAAIGALAGRFGTSIIFPVYAGISLATAALVLRVPAVHSSAAPRLLFSGLSVAVPESVKAVVRNRAYLALLLASLFAFVGLRAALTFLPILVEELGGSVADVGFAHSIAALSEIPFLFLSSWILARYRGPALITFLLGVLSLRLFGYTLLVDTTQLFLLQLSHGPTFGLFLAATVAYIHQIAPPKHRGLFQALAPSIYFGVGSIAGSWVGGLVIERFTVETMYRLAALSALIGTIILCVAAGDKERAIDT